MLALIITLSILFVWIGLSVVVALGIGRAIQIADRRDRETRALRAMRG